MRSLLSFGQFCTNIRRAGLKSPTGRIWPAGLSLPMPGLTPWLQFKKSIVNEAGGNDLQVIEWVGRTRLGESTHRKHLNPSDSFRSLTSVLHFKPTSAVLSSSISSISLCVQVRIVVSTIWSVRVAARPCSAHWSPPPAVSVPTTPSCCHCCTCWLKLDREVRMDEKVNEWKVDTHVDPMSRIVLWNYVNTHSGHFIGVKLDSTE